RPGTWRGPLPDRPSRAAVGGVVPAADTVGELPRRVRRLDALDLVPVVHDEPVGDLPVAMAPLEAIDVPAAEGLEERTLLVPPLLVGEYLRLHGGRVGAGEVDDRVADDVHRGLA